MEFEIQSISCQRGRVMLNHYSENAKNFQNLAKIFSSKNQKRKIENKIREQDFNAYNNIQEKSIDTTNYYKDFEWSKSIRSPESRNKLNNRLQNSTPVFSSNNPIDDSQFFKFNPKIRLNGKSSIIVKGASKINDQIRTFSKQSRKKSSHQNKINFNPPHKKNQKFTSDSKIPHLKVTKSFLRYKSKSKAIKLSKQRLEDALNSKLFK